MQNRTSNCIVTGDFNGMLVAGDFMGMREFMVAWMERTKQRWREASVIF